MANVTFKGSPVLVLGNLPTVGNKAPDFKLVNAKLEDVTLASYTGKKKILTINPSYDTGVCQATARTFNKKASELKDTVVLAISADLPFAQGRFCAAEGLDNVVTLSMMRDKAFGKDYGVLIPEGPFGGLTARAVVVLDENNKVLHTELVSEIATEPNYDAALAVLK